MIAFNTILYVIYFIIGGVSYPYLKRSYFPQNATGTEKFIVALLGLSWFLSVPVTLIIKEDSDGGEEQ